MSNPAPITLDQLFRYYAKLPHQLAAISELEQDIAANGYAAAMRRDRPWFSVWSQAGKASDRPGLPRPTNPLAVPYFPQLDNGPEGWRQCQTSSIAMALAYLGTPGIRDDLDYLRVVQRHGDTTSQAAHQAALADLGVRARFVSNASPMQLLAELKGGLPVPCGILHHGSASAPSGGGHWVCAIGWTADAWVVHDPYGELDLVHGGWVARGGTSGKGQRYSRRNFNARWCPGGPASGWAWLFS